MERAPRHALQINTQVKGKGDKMAQKTGSKTVKKNHNRLKFEKSPYLLQHAENPVNWYPWGDEAFAKALKENKPIFLSIGYSTCHWCHVMAHESFEDPNVAELMNNAFISIKVDREERPDIDKVYMTVCQMFTGSGGWPLTIIMTPEKKPFFATTYLPKESRFGRVGMLDLIPKVQEVWTDRQDEALSSAEKITSTLQKTVQDAPGDELDESILKIAYDQLTHRFDTEHGGFSDAPKFPTPHNLFFLLRYWKRTGDSKALAMVEKTLQKMRMGGIYDHIGFGFHRYSTDPKWLVPHFEKMLYDQALLAMAYTEAYQATGREEYAKTVREIFSYILRDMTATEGGFYSAEDADSEGKEGKFYLWTLEEIGNLLSVEETDLIARVFNLEEKGNFLDESTGKRTGTNILHVSKSIKEVATELNTSEEELQEHLDPVLQTLFAYREKRVRPHKDDKVLTDWNGLMIAALAMGARVFDEHKYADAAEHAVDFVLENMRASEGRLLHARGGHANVPAFLDDYAFFIWGLLELYESTFNVRYLQTALELNKDLIEQFWDDDNGGFYFTPKNSEDLLFRQKEVYDGAVPSGNSVAMLNLLRLGRITGNSDLEDMASRIGGAFSGGVKQAVSAHTQLMIAVDFGLGPSFEVVIVGNPEADDTKEMLKAVRKQFMPNKVVILRPTERDSVGIDDLTGFTRQFKSIDGKATAYVCLDYNCRLPTADVGKMLELFDVK